MSDVLTRLGVLVAELQSIGCDVSVVDAGVTVTIRYPVARDGGLDPATARRIVDEVAAEPAKPRPRETRPAKPAASERRAQRLREPISYGEVALIANSARERGESMRDAVAKHFGINKPAADMRIQTARKNGFDIPRGAAPKPAAPAEQKPQRPTFTPDDATRIIEEGAGADD